MTYDTTAKLQKWLHSAAPSGERTNERGNAIASFYADAERYVFDFELCTPDDGWQQYDTAQDAWYFGVWVNVKRRQTLTYAEGDVMLVTCPDDACLKAELDDAAEVYGPPPPAFTSIDRNGSLTKYYDTRPTVELAP